MNLKHRIERLEREFRLETRNTLYLEEIEFLYRMHKKYGQKMESAPRFLRSEYERLVQIYNRNVKPAPKQPVAHRGATPADDQPRGPSGTLPLKHRNPAGVAPWKRGGDR